MTLEKGSTVFSQVMGENTVWVSVCVRERYSSVCVDNMVEMR